VSLAGAVFARSSPVVRLDPSLPECQPDASEAIRSPIRRQGMSVKLVIRKLDKLETTILSTHIFV
jgi:hypothetical protein